MNRGLIFAPTFARIVMLANPLSRPSMPDYRVYMIGEDGHFFKAINLICADDAAAIESAKQLMDGYDLELWQLDRKVARFPQKPE
jgi:hypothetical protein